MYPRPKRQKGEGKNNDHIDLENDRSVTDSKDQHEGRNPELEPSAVEVSNKTVKPVNAKLTLPEMTEISQE